MIEPIIAIFCVVFGVLLILLVVGMMLIELNDKIETQCGRNLLGEILDRMLPRPLAHKNQAPLGAEQRVVRPSLTNGPF